MAKLRKGDRIKVYATVTDVEPDRISIHIEGQAHGPKAWILPGTDIDIVQHSLKINDHVRFLDDPKFEGRVIGFFNDIEAAPPEGVEYAWVRCDHKHDYRTISLDRLRRF